ncbi:MAG: UDP-3-O-[3-hydroxymyristoyl] N-acetylglucosamine deacetylase [Bacteroidales bacterium]|jgi:UDP-3-O-[3-hydroxymyristoyl] N-acetylglucosamine deacetylase/3-hydroxyacyl-[acyl-carrier-protein] dehydratase|nr:UDP-3-O-[3-hydroxymyristoyl] N-acetylglucosamine deacetylase [Bacteroidales bacterium]
MNQKTLKNTYFFEGKGLHTGTYAHMKVMPAPADFGIRFYRVDLEGQPEIEALAQNVTNTSRSTTIGCGEAQAVTIEHIMSALTGLGVDNARIELDNQEVPILNGSAEPYVKAFQADGLEDQGVPRQYITLPLAIEVSDPRTGSWVKIEPADAPSAHITVDFNSPVLGVQQAHWDEQTDYASEIAPCRTFCFYREIEPMLKNNLIKGGDLSNALVVTDTGYMDDPVLHFPDECGRHKLLDLLGDFRLAGGYLNARITAFKPGHPINTKAAKAIRALLK